MEAEFIQGYNTSCRDIFELLYKTLDDYDIKDVITRKGFGVNIRNGKGDTPLQVAVSLNKPNHVLTLLKCGAALDVTDDTGKTPLMVAATGGNVDILKALLVHGADVNAVTSRKETALVFAVSARNKQTADVLLENKADPNVVCSNGLSPLILAVHNQCSKVVKLLLRYHADVEHQDDFGCTVLHYASGNSDPACLEILLDCKGNLDVLDKNGDAPFVYAIRQNSWRCLEALIEAGCDLTNMDGLNATAVGLATLCNSLESLHVLIKKGEDVDENTYFGSRPLLLAAHPGFSEITQLLLENGADSNHRNKQGICAIHKALLVISPEIEPKRHEAVKHLLKFGADPNIQVKGRGLGCPQLTTGIICPMSLAIGTGHLSLVKLLLIAGNKVNLQDLNEWKAQSLANNMAYLFFSCEEILQLIRDWTSEIRTLSFLCRSVIRSLLPSPIPHSINRLEMAPLLKRYLNYSDMDNIQVEPVSILDKTLDGFPRQYYVCTIDALKTRYNLAHIKLIRYEINKLIQRNNSVVSNN